MSGGKDRVPEPAVGIKDIARALGVSTGTVDRALHGKPEVSAATRARVLGMAESLGYRPESRRALPEVAPSAPHRGAAPAKNRALLGLTARGHPRSRGAIRAGTTRGIRQLSATR